ncbi:hypothetical protein A2U01_0104528, partial [Trifolium medium]|nr:hypothetical protein [Trifolium medium]
MPRETRFALVGNLSRKSRHARMETFRGICVCQMKPVAASKVTPSWAVKS